jgi:pimeloyl-ACP methyl ester carboxylesterase
MAVHIINLRCPPDGEEVTQNPQAIPPLSSDQSIFLIHGYNDSLADAREAYASFLNPSYDQALIRSLGPDASSDYIRALNGDTLESISRWGEICLVFWPATVWGVFSAAAYVPELRLAAASANALASVLMGIKQTPQPQIALISHSMGNRLALQMLSVSNPAIPCRTMCLMAAAVAVEMVTGTAQPYLWPSIAAIERKRVLYSKNDDVLKMGFPIGEAFAGEGTSLTAVGHAGDPLYAWTDTKNMRPYGHGDYWAATNDKDGTTSRDIVLDFLSTTMLPYSSTNKVDPKQGPASSSIANNAIRAHRTPTHRVGT